MDALLRASAPALWTALVGGAVVMQVVRSRAERRCRTVTVRHGGTSATLQLARADGAAQWDDLVRKATGMEAGQRYVLEEASTGRLQQVSLSMPSGTYNVRAGAAMHMHAPVASHVSAAPPSGAKAPPPRPAPTISGGASWGIADADTGRLLFEHNAQASKQPASTIKILAALLVVTAAEADGEGLEATVTVSKAAANTNRGTVAELRQGEKYTAEQLLYGLLLPSGNDAAVALAEHYGPRFEPGTRTLPDGKFYSGAWEPESPVGRFVAEMNRRAATLGCTATEVVNPHGMGHAENRTCVLDMVIIASAAWKHEVFRRVVGTYVHRCTAQGRMVAKPKRWVNTNDMLQAEGDRCIGVKTGWVPVRREDGSQRIHGCLVTITERGDAASGASSGGEASSSDVVEDDSDRRPRRLMVVVLGVLNKSLRFVDTQKLLSWAWAQV